MKRNKTISVEQVRNIAEQTGLNYEIYYDVITSDPIGCEFGGDFSDQGLLFPTIESDSIVFGSID